MNTFVDTHSGACLQSEPPGAAFRYVAVTMAICCAVSLGSYHAIKTSVVG